ncbi:MAG TPA: flagellar hook-associated protein FlgK [Conexibacter sp.]|jgi:flagellar hook-associated protein 1 FlgK
MSLSTFSGLQVALRGLMAQQMALDTTGHNIANANTLGYSRQTVDMTTMPALTLPSISGNNGNGVQLGMGVDVTQIQRVRDSFLDIQYRSENMQYGDSSARADALGQAELAFDEPSETGVNQLLSNFYDAWSAVQHAPNDPSARTTLIRAAGTLASAFASVSDQLTRTATDAQEQYDAITGPSGDVESMAKQLAQLNTAISHATAVGQAPNDLLDQRDELLDRLSGLAQVSVTQNRDGTDTVDFGGVTLVDPRAANGYTWPQTLTNPGGQLGALQALASPTGPAMTYKGRLDGVVAELVRNVNDIYSRADGRNFFDPAGTTADALAVIATDANLVTGTDTTSAGSDDIATAIAALRGGQVDRNYASLVAEVGSDVKDSDNQQRIQLSLLDSIEQRRLSVQGVATDEEMTNLIQFQRGYQASARVMTTLDSMLDTLINRTGTTGL